MVGFDVHESETPSLKAVYEDIQAVLKAPLVSCMFRVLGGYEKGLVLAWKEMRPNLLTLNSKKAADNLRLPKFTAQVPRVEWSKYYGKPSIENIRSTVQTLNEVHAKLLLVICAWAESLSGRPNEGGQKVLGTLNPKKPEGSLRLLQPSDAASRVRAMLSDSAQQHGHFQAGDDFCALADYPQFLRLSWKHLRQFVGTNEYILLCERLKNDAIRLTKQMPHAVAVDHNKMKAFYSSAEIAGFTGIVAMYQQMLPTMIVDGEFFRRILVS